jgi:hypothetical protein
LNASQLGHRAAAQGDATGNPFSFRTQVKEHDAWTAAYARVDTLRKSGLDPDGHQPPPPHLCTRDSTRVCNCCHACTTNCWTEGLPKLPSLGGLLRKVVKKVLR